MNHIEPNVSALMWFVVLWSACCFGFFQLAGMYPINERKDDAATGSKYLVFGNTVLWVALLAGTAAFAYAELRWTSSVVVGGILFLFIPEALQAVPARWRDGTPGLAVICCGLALSLTLLTYVAGDSIKSLLS